MQDLKILFLTHHYNDEYAKTGIGKKITDQFNTLSNYFEEAYISCADGKKCYIKNTEYAINYNNRFDKRKKMLTLLLNLIFEKKITHIYIRYTHFADASFIDFLKKIHGKVKILLEIPTYPYDGEYKFELNKKYLSFTIEKKYRKKMKKYIDYVVTFSSDKEIFDIPCINISNGINFSDIQFRKTKKETKKIVFTSISSCDYWHGIDRFLNSLNQYVEQNPTEKIKFNIVGEGSETPKLKQIVQTSENLSKVVVFHGFKSGKELDEIYNETDIGIGCLGNHRKGIYTIQALKNKEYAAKGLPMIFSEDDPGLRGKEYVYRATHDEELIDIADLIQWYQKLTITPEEIRESVKEFSWENQMKIVIDKINEIK
ncbi:MAG: glycosyltransferase [Culicoidibacterales bacterium]